MNLTRRSFLNSACLGTAAVSLSGLTAQAKEKVMQGFDDTKTSTDMSKVWIQTSNRKVRVGIVGYGACKFGAAFGFQNHPNVDIIAVSDLIPERCKKLAAACRCNKTYPSLEEMVKDDSIEAIFVATDAPSHARHAILTMKHGKHVASAVPAIFGSLEDADRLIATVKSTGLNYMMFETSAFHNDMYAIREIDKVGGLGRILYSEGEYYHYMARPIPSFKDWRVGLPPQWYPTHSNAYYVAIAGGSFTEVSCMGIPSIIEHLTPSGNAYKNPFGTEIALLRTSEGGMSRMAVSWDTPGASGEMGRIRADKGTYYGEYKGHVRKLPNLRKPPLPKGVKTGGHGGSHGYLTNEFIMSIIENRKPLIDVVWALNMSVAGIVAHQSALKDGELLKIPQFSL
jgi:predicted dehydrogenase